MYVFERTASLYTAWLQETRMWRDPIQVASILHIVCWSGTVQWRNESASFPKRLYLPADRINWVSSSYTITSPAASKITSNYRWRWRWNLLKYLPCCRFWLILYIWISSFTLLNSSVCLILHSKVASTVLLQCLSCIRQQKTGSGAQNCFETSAQLRPALQFL